MADDKLVRDNYRDNIYRNDLDFDPDFEEVDLDTVKTEHHQRIENRRKNSEKSRSGTQSAEKRWSTTQNTENNHSRQKRSIDERTSRSRVNEEDTYHHRRRNETEHRNRQGRDRTSRNRSEEESRRSGGKRRKRNRSRRRRRQQRIRRISLLLVLIFLILVIAILLTRCRKEKNNSSLTEKSGTTNSKSSVAFTFPYELKEGLTVNSIFITDLDNPDDGNEYADNVVSIEIKNESDQTLVSGDFEVTLDDGTVVPFHVSYLPAGEKLWTFATDNAATEKVVCQSIAMTSCEMTGDELLDSDNFTTYVDGESVNITNNSSQEKSNVTIYCHCKFDDILYGGIIYTYSVDSISAGETYVIDASDCWLGEAEVVAISSDN